MFKHLPKDLRSVNEMKQACGVFLPDFNQKPTENTAKTLCYYLFLTLVFSKHSCVNVRLSNIITSSQRHNEHNVFANKKVDLMISPGCNAFCILSNKQIRIHFNYFQIKTNVQTALESHDLTRIFVYLIIASNSFA